MKKLLAITALVVIFAGCAPTTETETSVKEPLQVDPNLTFDEKVQLHAASSDYDCPASDATPKCQDPATVKEGELRKGPKVYCVWLDDNCENVKYIEETN